MKCAEFEGLKNAYLEKKLEKKQSSLLEKHLDSCAECRVDIRFFESIKSHTGWQLKAPENFTEAIMNKVYKIGSKDKEAADIGKYFARLFKNAGASLVLASLVMIFSFFIPWANSYRTYISRDLQNTDAVKQTCGIKYNLSGMNDKISSILQSIHNSVAKFKEGT